VDPEYTDQARKKKLSGSCEIEIVVDAQGNPRDIRCGEIGGRGFWA
jgi:outer membrane biosynthesis protein TonB